MAKEARTQAMRFLDARKITYHLLNKLLTMITRSRRAPPIRLARS